MSAPDDVEAQLDAQALGVAMNCFLHSIAPQQRDIFIRRYWYFDSIADIAKRFSVSESKIKTTLFRTRNHLRQHLEKEGFAV